MGLRIARNEHLRIVRVDRWCRNIDRLHTCISAGRGQAALKWTIAFMLVTFSTHAIEAQTNPPSEYQIEAAFLFNFAKFVDWPTDSFTNPHSFAICVLGKDPFGHLLDDALLNKTIADRSVVIERLKDNSEVRRCQTVFVSSSESAHLAEILESLRGANVLLVGETAGFAASGGIIEFTLEDGHVRFTINTDAADRAGLKFSAKLLSLAKIVHDEGHSKGG